MGDHTIYFPGKNFEKAKIQARRRGLSVSAYINQLIDDDRSILDSRLISLELRNELQK